MRRRVVTLLMVFVVVGCAAPSGTRKAVKEFPYGVMRNFQEAQCAQYLESERRDACYRDAKKSAEQYERERASAKK